MTSGELFASARQRLAPMVVADAELDVGRMAAGGNSTPSPTAAPPRTASFLISGIAPGFLNEPVMEIGAGSEPMVKCLASVLIW